MSDQRDSGHTPQSFETLAIHAGQTADPATGAVVPPIYQVSTYKQDGVGGLRGGYEYSRSANPTRTALEGALAAVEEGERGFAFASGLAAEDTLLRAVCGPGDHVVIPDDAYGGTHRLFDKVERGWGLDHSPAPVSDVEAVRAAIRPGQTKLVWIETPTNPLLNIGDIEALAGVAHEAGALMVVEMVLVLADPRAGFSDRPMPGDPRPGYSNTKALGEVLYTDYVYPFQLAAVVLLVAIIAAIALTMRKRKDTRYQDPARQVTVRREDRVRIVSMPVEKRD